MPFVWFRERSRRMRQGIRRACCKIGLRLGCLTVGCLTVGSIAVAVADEPGSGARHLLAYKFALNQRVQYQLTTKTEIKYEFNEQQETTSNHSDVRRTYRVANVAEDGSAELE